MSFRDEMRDWQDFDVAEHLLGKYLGIFPQDSRMSDFKGTFWSANRLGDGLAGLIQSMVDNGFLEQSNCGTQFRWNEGAPDVS